MTAVHAQDVKAVERRLGGAVEAGELSLEQAKVMMDALRKSAGRGAARANGKGGGPSPLRVYFRKYQEDIKSRVDAGKLSPADAKAKIEAMRKKVAAKSQANTGKRRSTVKSAKPKATRAGLAEVQQKLRKAVANGDLSAADARKKLQAFTQGSKAKANNAKAAKSSANKNNARLAEAQQRLRKAVANGDLSAADARKKLQALQQSMTDRPIGKNANKKNTQKKNTARKPAEQRALRQRYADYQKRLNSAVENGRLSREQAAKMLKQMRERMFGNRSKTDSPQRGKDQVRRRRPAQDTAVRKPEQDRKKAAAEADKKRKDQQNRRRRFAALKHDVEAAVKNGEMTQAAAGKKLFEAEKNMLGNVR